METVLEGKQYMMTYVKHVTPLQMKTSDLCVCVCVSV